MHPNTKQNWKIQNADLFVSHDLHMKWQESWTSMFNFLLLTNSPCVNIIWSLCGVTVGFSPSENRATSPNDVIIWTPRGVWVSGPDWHHIFWLLGSYLSLGCSQECHPQISTTTVTTDDFKKKPKNINISVSNCDKDMQESLIKVLWDTEQIDTRYR